MGSRVDRVASGRADPGFLDGVSIVADENVPGPDPGVFKRLARANPECGSD